MLDTDIVHALIAGGVDGLAKAYTRYADRLYDYCARLTGDHEAAADAVHDTFLIARERITRLRDPEALGPWLYALARSRCHHAPRPGPSLPSPSDEAGEGTDGDAATSTGRPDPRDVVDAALHRLSPHEREIVDLTLRHDLEPSQLAAVLGVDLERAHTLSVTARTQLERALDTAFAARARHRCPALRETLAGWTTRLPSLSRRLVSRHLRTCAACEGRRALSAASLLAMVPLLPAPPELHDQLLASVQDPELAAHHAEFATAAGPYRSDGFPRESATRSSWTLAWGAVAALVTGLVLLGGTLLTGRLGYPLGPAMDEVTGEPPQTIHADNHEPGTAAQPTDITLVRSEGHDTSKPGCERRWDLSVTAITMGDVESAVVTWHRGDHGGKISMSPGPDPGTWYALVRDLPPGERVYWSVTVTGVDGAQRSSAQRWIEREECSTEA